MKSQTTIFVLLTLSFSASAQMPVAEYMKTPEWHAQELFNAREYAALDSLVADLAKTKARSKDGRYELWSLTAMQGSLLAARSEAEDKELEERLQEWRKAVPDSAFEPIFEALWVHITAWRARGGGLSSDVTPEG